MAKYQVNNMNASQECKVSDLALMEAFYVNGNVYIKTLDTECRDDGEWSKVLNLSTGQINRLAKNRTVSRVKMQINWSWEVDN